jgi:aminoglycoside phosphotransferase (APT) family kinase protein
MTLDPHILANALARMAGGAVLPLDNLYRLTGGANMESWSFDWGGHGYVLRRAPSPEMMAGRAFGHDVEAAIIRAARATGVKAPEIVGELIDGDGLGTGFIMVRVEAEVSPGKILAAPPAGLIDDIARELARVHEVPLEELTGVPQMDTGAALAELKARFIDYGGDRPIIALAIRWLEDHLPTPAAPVLVHGDFRMGNLMVDSAGLAAVLDWELAHIGDAHEDLAWGCVNAWRFGRIDKPAFGCADLPSYFAAYEGATSTKVEPDRFRFWLIYRTLWWALGCLQMGEIWRTGVDRSLERAVIGRRTSENEIDLLMLLEEDAPESERGRIALEMPFPPRRQGEPSATELIEAITDWVESDIKPRAEGRDRFMAAVALNALGMLARETGQPFDVHDKALADDLLMGRATLASAGILMRLKKGSLAKLARDVPKYSALAKAKELWLESE